MLRIIKRNRDISLLMIVLVGGLVLQSCSDGVVYETKVELSPVAWNLDNPVQIKVPVQDSLTKYNLILDLEYNSSYSYRNIYFFVDVTGPNQNHYRDTIECLLSSPRGDLYGEKHGNKIEQELIYRYNNYFPNSGEYTFNIQHAMRDTLLQGICSIGLKLVESTQK